jgi:hypothetical protein
MKKWTYKGIKRFYPNLEFKIWLEICKKRQQFEKSQVSVCEGFV